MKNQPDRLLAVVDCAGIVVFAMGGALVAIGADLDFFGVMVNPSQGGIA